MLRENTVYFRKNITRTITLVLVYNRIYIVGISDREVT